MKDFNIICAVAMNGIIGDSVSNAIPWHLSADLQNFKRLTSGKTIVMGARTFNSLGRKLPNRRHVVITRGAGGTHLDFQPDATYPSFADVLRYEPAGFFVIGGEHIFAEALRYLPSNLYITPVYIDAVGDVRFPIVGRRFIPDHLLYETSIYDETARSEMMNENGIDFQFTTFTKRTGLN